MQNRFELYMDHPQFAEAEAAISAALEHAATLPNWDAARDYMEVVLTKYQDAGAFDSEPRNHVHDALNGFFPDDPRDFWDGTTMEQHKACEEEIDTELRTAKLAGMSFKDFPKKTIAELIDAMFRYRFHELRNDRGLRNAMRKELKQRFLAIN